MTTQLERLEQLEDILVSCATNRNSHDEDYKKLRAEEYEKLRLEFLRDSTVKDRLPQFVINHNKLSKFWGFIQPKFASYKERKVFIENEFASLIVYLEQNIVEGQPGDDHISAILVNAEHVHTNWQKALERRNEDPEAAIAMARTLIESVCKHILDEVGVSHTDKDDLPTLYKTTAKQLNMAPEQHQEEVFKKILGSCQTVIEGLGTLRNKLSDAHGKNKKAVKPSVRHAALAVNLAGSMAAFLIATWEERTSKNNS